VFDGCITYIQRHFNRLYGLYFNGYAGHFSNISQIQREKAGCSARSNPPCVGTRNGKEETPLYTHIFDPAKALAEGTFYRMRASG
jgi:hypothetical protein